MVGCKVDEHLWAVLGRSWDLCIRHWAVLDVCVSGLEPLEGLCWWSWLTLEPPWVSVGFPGLFWVVLGPSYVDGLALL